MTIFYLFGECKHKITTFGNDNKKKLIYDMTILNVQNRQNLKLEFVFLCFI